MSSSRARGDLLRVRVALKGIRFLTLGAVFAASFTFVSAGASVKLMVGARTLYARAFEPGQEQRSFGLSFAAWNEGWPVAIEWGFQKSEGEGTFYRRGYRHDVEPSVAELDVGILKEWRSAKTWIPYVGGGLAVVSAGGYGQNLNKWMGTWTTEDGTAPGGYLHGGILFCAGGHFILGLDLRLVGTSQIYESAYGFSVNYGYTQAALVLGWR